MGASQTEDGMAMLRLRAGTQRMVPYRQARATGSQNDSQSKRDS